MAEDSSMEWGCLRMLPPGLSPGFASQPVRVGDVYSTTSQHAYKQRSSTTPNLPIQKKAPGCWKVHHTMYTINKCEEKAWAPALTMAHQSSEMKSKFQGKPDSIKRTLPESLNHHPLQHLLEDHQKNQRTKDLSPSSTNSSVKGRPVEASEGGMFYKLEPYLTTNHTYHRYFPPQERKGYPRNDVATYWICENYPKSRGYGLDSNPLEKEEVERPEEKGPMRDRLVFSKLATTPQTPHSHKNKPIPSALRSQHWDDYTAPSASNTRELFHCPVPPLPPVNKDTSLMQTVPHLYKSVNSSYGTPLTHTKYVETAD